MHNPPFEEVFHLVQAFSELRALVAIEFIKVTISHVFGIN
jgi:hypothetical protein